MTIPDPALETECCANGLFTTQIPGGPYPLAPLIIQVCVYA